MMLIRRPSDKVEDELEKKTAAIKAKTGESSRSAIMSEDAFTQANHPK